ncbi:MAG: DciA family protein [Vicinamibacteria bacterium]
MLPAHDALSRVMADILRKAPPSAERATLAWRLAVGASMARVTTVTLSSDGVLVVTAQDAHWQKEVRRASRLIVPRLNELLGEGAVRAVEVR